MKPVLYSHPPLGPPVEVPATAPCLEGVCFLSLVLFTLSSRQDFSHLSCCRAEMCKT